MARVVEKVDWSARSDYGDEGWEGTIYLATNDADHYINLYHDFDEGSEGERDFDEVGCICMSASAARRLRDRLIDLYGADE